MKNIIKRLAIIPVALLILVACNNTKTTVEQKPTESSNPYLEEWENQKFSMFIHWGIYSLPAGIWEGKQISGYSEQIKGHAKIPTDDYRKLAKDFNPVNWDADAVAQLAKDAGVKSIVITSKHHDGFCMFDTQYSDFNVVDATPYKKDVIKELADACQRKGLRFGVYFSLIDWDYEHALPFVSTRNSDSIPPLHHQYNLNQVEELLSNYGPISELWFDMSAPTYQQSKEIADLVKKLQPNCMVSGRLWNDQGDFVVMGDNYTPDFKIGVPWQTPASMFHETWSYRSWQKRDDVDSKIKEKIHDLLNIVSSGGNYLLNIGPKGDGSIVKYESDVLKAMGEWLKTNGDAIYNTHVSPIERPTWGYLTAKSGKLYIHITDFPDDNILVLEGVSGKIKDVYALADASTKLKVQSKDGDINLELPETLTKDPYATVLVMEYDDELAYVPSNIIDLHTNETTSLNAENGDQYFSYSGQDYYTSKPTVILLKWHLKSHKKNKYTLQLNYPGDLKDKLLLSINNKKFTYAIKSDFEKPIAVELTNEAIHTIQLRYKNPSNPHDGLNTDNLKIELK